MNERRGNPRVPVEFDAVLNYREHALICTVRDISLNGAFIQAPPEELPFANAAIEIALTVTNGGEAKYFRIPARISRITENGAAIAFSDVGLDTYSSLVGIIYNA